MGKKGKRRVARAGRKARKGLGEPDEGLGFCEAIQQAQSAQKKTALERARDVVVEVRDGNIQMRLADK